MRIERIKIKGSPFIGVFALATDRIGLFPVMEKKEVKKIVDVLDIEVIQTLIGNSNLIGVLARGNSKGITVGELIERNELKFLEEQGVKVKTVRGLNAFGNLLALNDSGGLISPLIPKETAREIRAFFRIPFAETGIAQTEIVGSCISCSNKGFVVHSNVSKKELALIEKTLKVKGMPSTVNYGDPFVSNGIIANSNGVLVGEQTSGHELLRIDEGLGGE